MLVCHKVCRSQLKSFVHLIRISPGHMPFQVFQACHTGKETVGLNLLEGIYEKEGMDDWKDDGWMDG